MRVSPQSRAIIIAIAALAVPAPAFAGSFTVSADGATLRVTGDGDDSVLAISEAAGKVRLNGNGTPIDASAVPSCTVTGGVSTEWDCPGPPTFTTLVVKMGDGNDVVCPAGCTAPAGLALDLDGGPNSDTTPPRHEEITGSPGPDRIYGGDSYDTLAGGAGADDIEGGPENDTIDGGPDDDVIRARDGRKDRSIDCGAGANDMAIVDDADDTIANCETIQRPGDGGGAGGGSPPAEQACVPSYGCFEGVGTTRTEAFPNLVGVDQRTAQSLLNALGMDWTPSSPKHPVRVRFTTANRLGAHPRGGTFREGDVIEQRPAAGTPVTYGVGDQVDVTLTIWGGPTRESCAEAAKDMAGLDLIAWERAMKDLRCTLDDVLVRLMPKGTTQKGEVDLNSGDRCEVARATRQKGRQIDATLEVPADIALQDVRIGFRETHLGPSFVASDDDREAWTLPVTGTQGARMVISAQDRSGALLDGVHLYLDARDVGGGLVDAGATGLVGGNKATRGSRSVVVDTRRPGTITVVAVAGDRNGNSICGAAQVRVTDPGTDYVTVSGNGWERRGGRWVRGAAGTARAASLADFFSAARRFLLDLFAPFHPNQTGDVAGTLRSGPAAKAIRKTFLTFDAGQVQVSGGRPLSGAAIPGLIGQDGGSLIGNSGNTLITGDGHVIDGRGKNVLLAVDRQGNLIGQDGGSLVGNSGNTLIGQDGGSLIGQDGGSIAPGVKSMARAQIVSTYGGGFISENGGAIVGAAGGRLMSAVSPMVAAGGGNLISRRGSR